MSVGRKKKGGCSIHGKQNSNKKEGFNAALWLKFIVSLDLGQNLLNDVWKKL